MFPNVCLACVASATPSDLLVYFFGPDALDPAKVHRLQYLVAPTGSAVEP